MSIMRSSGSATYYSMKYDPATDVTSFGTHQGGTITIDDYISTYMSSANDYALTVTFKKAGYYRIQTSGSASPQWVYKSANSTVICSSGANYVAILYYSDLKQH